MRKAVIPIIIGIVSGIIGFYSGKSVGYTNGTITTERLQNLKPIEEIRAELKAREAESITQFISGKAGINQVDEGSFFETKIVQYFSGSLTNSAVMATVKDVRLNVDFYSKTNTKIGNQEIVIYDYIKPGSTVNFKEQINIPDKVEEFKFQIIDAKTE
jgi:hypothetical protein